MNHVVNDRLAVFLRYIFGDYTKIASLKRSRAEASELNQLLTSSPPSLRARMLCGEEKGIPTRLRDMAQPLGGFLLRRAA